MRIRSFALAAAAVSALLLAGCSGGPTPPDTSPSAQIDDLCDAAAPSGAASEAVTVEGEPGAQPTATFAFPLEITELERTVVTEGEGDPVEAGELISYAVSAWNAETGEQVGAVGYQDGEILPAQISPDSPTGQLLGCAAPGTRVVGTFPATETTASQVFVLDFLEVVPVVATGAAQAAPQGFPVVELAEDGEPSVTVPDGDIPSTFQKATLKKGDGTVVAAGDSVLVQYYGVSWNDGEEFDKSWGGQPFGFTVGSGVVQGFTDAVTGETVGSQIVAVLPPSAAYGEGEINEDDLVGQTLIFVVDILAVQKAPAP